MEYRGIVYKQELLKEEKAYIDELLEEGYKITSAKKKYDTFFFETELDGEEVTCILEEYSKEEFEYLYH